MLLKTLLAAASLVDASNFADSVNCKAHPSLPSWPSHSDWSAFNDTLGGSLIKPTPPGAVCYRNHKAYDEVACEVALKRWHAYDFHVPDPVSVKADPWAGWQCMPDAAQAQNSAETNHTMPIITDEVGPEKLELRDDFGHPGQMKPNVCSADLYPAYVVNASNTAHVKAAVDFASKHNVRLIVHATGHDMMGRSIASGALSIWTRYLNSVTYHADDFVLAGGSGKTVDGPTITAGAGTWMYDLYKEADRHGRAIVGGGAKTVSVGGLVTGGGHGILSPHDGLAADNVIQAEIVTPQGNILTLNEELNSDLFWAVRGGGGSTFGVLTSVTFKTHLSKKLDSAYVFAYAEAGTTEVMELMTWGLRKLPTLSDSNFTGYMWSVKSGEPPFSLPNIEGKVGGFFAAGMILDPQEPDAIAKLLKPLKMEAEERWGEKVHFSYQPQSYASFLEWFEVSYDKEEGANSVYLVSRLLPRQVLELAETELSAVVGEVTEQLWGMGAYLVAGKGVKEATPAGGSNAVHPAWRTALVHALTWEAFPTYDLDAREQAKTTLDKAFEPLRQLTTGGGSYVNEALPWEKDWQQAFWGSNYDRLLKIKRDIDPMDVLWCTPCVGSERWAEVEVQGGRHLCRVE